MRIFATILLLALTCLLCSCVTRVEFRRIDAETSLLTANTKVVAELTRKPDGEETWKLDTSGQGVWDRVKAGATNLINYLGRSLDSPAVSVE